MIRPNHLLLFTSRSTRVAIRGSRGVSTIPLTISSPEHRTIFLRASTEPLATKPSRRWQPPRVTSTPACNTVVGFVGDPEPGGGAHPPIPREGVLREVLGDWADLAL